MNVIATVKGGIDFCVTGTYLAVVAVLLYDSSGIFQRGLVWFLFVCFVVCLLWFLCNFHKLEETIF